MAVLATLYATTLQTFPLVDQQSSYFSGLDPTFARRAEHHIHIASLEIFDALIFAVPLKKP